MRARDRLILEAIYTCWAAKDLDAVLACCADDIVFRMYLSEEIAPFAGETRGKSAIIPRLKMIIAEFDFLAYRPLFIRDDGETLHSQIYYHYRHKRTGHQIEGTMRHVVKFDGDQMTELNEYHDSPRLHAYFELLAESESEKPARAFPNIKRNR